MNITCGLEAGVAVGDVIQSTNIPSKVSPGNRASLNLGGFSQVGQTYKM